MRRKEKRRHREGVKGNKDKRNGENRVTAEEEEENDNDKEQTKRKKKKRR